MPTSPCHRRRWLSRVLLSIGVVYGVLILLWYNTRLADLVPASVNRTLRPKFGEVEVVPITRKALPASRKKQLPRLILSPQGRAAMRKGEEAKAKATETVDQRNETQTTENPKVIQTPHMKEKVNEAEDHATMVRNYPRGETRKRSLRCVGWKATGDYNPNGPRLPDNDHSCMTRVLAGASGYCEVEDTESGEKFRVGRRFCNSIKAEAVFRCSDAINFANFPVMAQEALNKALELLLV